MQIEFSAYTKVIFSLCKKNFWMLCSRYLFVQIEFSKSGVFVHFVLLCANRIYQILASSKTECNALSWDFTKQNKLNTKLNFFQYFHSNVHYSWSFLRKFVVLQEFIWYVILFWVISLSKVIFRSGHLDRQFIKNSIHQVCYATWFLVDRRSPRT